MRYAPRRTKLRNWDGGEVTRSKVAILPAEKAGLLGQRQTPPIVWPLRYRGKKELIMGKGLTSVFPIRMSKIWLRPSNHRDELTKKIAELSDDEVRKLLEQLRGE